MDSLTRAQLASDRAVSIHNNYLQRSDFPFKGARSLIRSISLGSFVSGVCAYSGAILDSESRFFNLVKGVCGH